MMVLLDNLASEVDQHDPGRAREREELPKPGKRLHGKPTPRLRAPAAHGVPKHPEEQQPPRDIQRHRRPHNPQLQNINKQPTHRRVNNQHRQRNPGENRRLQLALQEPLHRELEREAEVQRDEPQRHHPRLLRHVVRLPQRLQDRRREDVERCRTYKEAEIEADDDGVRNGDGGELHLAQMPGEGLGHDVHGKRRHAAEDGGAHYVPQLFRFDPNPRVQVPISLLIIIVISAPINNVVGKRIRRRFRQQQRPSNLVLVFLVGFHFSSS
nr:hypothetical protein Iba_chr15fCG4700 [Ipomoea batatas]